MFKKKKEEELLAELESTNSGSAEDMSYSKPKKGTWKIVFGLAVAGLLAAYGGGTYYYSSHFPHNMYANGHKLGEMTVEEAERSFTHNISEHSIIIKEKERQEVLNAGDINTVITVGNRVRRLFEETNPWLWFIEFTGKQNHKLPLDVTYDKKALKKVIKSMEGFQKKNIQKPVSAKIKAGEKEFEIIPEVPGNVILEDKFIEAIEECLSTCKTKLDLVEADLYKKPKYFSTDKTVTDALDKANKYTKGSIVHDFLYTTETLDYSKTKNWITISKDFKVKLKEDKVGEYVVSLGKKYNTMGSARPFTTAYGEKRSVYYGDYGWKIYFDKEKKQLIKDIKSGKDIKREPIYSYKAAIRTEETDIPDSYVEVSIDRQEVWLIIDGECVLDTSCVTGKPPHGTEIGVYGLTYKKRDDYLEGYNTDGTTYRSHVDYWMPFNGNQGLHDASWRNSFGGSIYKSNGSHGCVNLPPYAAAIIYKYVDTNFPVIIY